MPPIFSSSALPDSPSSRLPLLPSSLRAVVGGLLDLLYPPRCLVCGAFGDVALCAGCRADFLPVGPAACGRCGLGIAEGEELCATCKAGKPHAFTQARAPGQFDGALRRAILRLKYGQRRALAGPLGQYLAAYLRAAPFAAQPDLVVPVPLHPSRLRSRGFNQSELVASVVAKALGMRLEDRALRRVRRTRPQVELHAAERAANVRDAFAVREPRTVEGRTVLLIDDVLTSLATVDECARVLVDAGARTVLVAGVARGG